MHIARLPEAVFYPDSIQQIEQSLAHQDKISLTSLMEKAGLALFDLIRQNQPEAKHWLILCGNGNNGGDGYVVARLARQQGIKVTLIACPGQHSLPDEADWARTGWLNAGGEILPAESVWPQHIDLIVDALLGIGLKQAPRPAYAQLIQQANQHPAPIIAMDVPSGLCALTGRIWQTAIVAQHTLAVVGLKPGLLTGKARDHVGSLHYSDLDLADKLSHYHCDLQRFDRHTLQRWLYPRPRCAHKGDFGKLLIIGGNMGFGGAIRLCAEAALRCGAGLVKVLTQQCHITSLLTSCPEAMVQAYSVELFQHWLDWADAIVVGPGLAKDSWSQSIYNQLAEISKPMLWDADALNLLALAPDCRSNRVITPHPGEAARLLRCSIADIENNRLLAAQKLAQRFGGVVVLKGAGTLVCDGKQTVIADVGNPGMATAGMGDTLSGIIGCLLGQNDDLFSAACMGALIHGSSADWVAQQQGEKGLLARDIIGAIPQILNNRWRLSC